VTICLNFDFDQGTATYTTTLSSGMKNGYKPPQQIEKFLVAQFVSFYVFDGELAEHLLDTDRTDAQTVIENLFQLSLFSEVAASIGEYYDRQTAGRSATEERGLSRRTNRVQLLRTRLEQMRNKKDEVLRQHSAIGKSINRKKEKFASALEKQREHGEHVHEAQLKLSGAKANVERLADEVLRKMRDPHAIAATFGLEMMNLKMSLDRVKLPESTAREFFEELAQEDKCVCGRELNEEFRRTIRERAKHYLGSDDVAFLNALKSDVANLVGTDSSIHETALNKTIETLLEATRHEDECRTAYNLLESDAVAADPDLQKAKDEIEELEQQLDELDGERQKYENMDDSLSDERTFGIRILERRLEDAERKLAEVTNTINLRRQRDVLCRIMKAAQEKARTGISNEICRDANDKITKLMPDNAIRIQKVDRCLVLEGQEGGSAGETLAVGYAFLATLFNRVEHQLPFIVDSPANPIDLRVRPEIARLIPKLTSQFVAFTISSERQNFTAPLESAACGPVQFLTLFRKGPPDLQKQAEAEKDVVATTDGFLVSGKSFFNRFHLETEEENNAVSTA
jgi:hypothetical protein